MTLLDELLEAIHSGNAPAVGALKPSEDLVDDYYMRLVQIIEAAQQDAQADGLRDDVIGIIAMYGNDMHPRIKQALRAALSANPPLTQAARC